MSAPPTSLDSVGEGLRRRDIALALLRARRAALVRAGQRALLSALLDRGEATADDVRAAVPLPEGIGPRVFGAVPLPLVEAGILRHSGYRPTRRPLGHGRPIAVWQLVDRASAAAWLRDHAELPDPEPDAPAQLILW